MNCTSKTLIFAITILMSCVTIVFLTGQYKYPFTQGCNNVFIDVGEILHETDEKFLSVALDTSFMRCTFHKLNEREWQQLEELASLLAPGFLRLGGKAADQVVFKQTLEPNNLTNVPDNCDLETTNDVLEITEPDWIKINNFVNKTNLNFIFDLNVLLRKSSGWDSSNAKSLIQTSAENGFCLDFQLGNEPNSFKHVFNISISGMQLAKDFNELRDLLNMSESYKHSKLIGPDVTRPKDLESSALEYLKEFLSATNSIDAVSWHQYYLNGRTAKMNDFLNPETFDIFPTQVDAVKKIVRQYSPELPVWISETSSAYGSGAPGLSDRFVASFLWLDKLGVAARSGISLVIRQSLLQGHYALIDADLKPNPDFWISLFYKRIVGTKVFNVTYDKRNRKKSDYLRFYSHCSIWNKSISNDHNDKIVVYALNFSNKTERAVVLEKDFKYPLYSFTFTADNENLTSKWVRLNDKKLVYEGKETIEDLLSHPEEVKMPLELPPYSIAFWIIGTHSRNYCD